MLALVYLIGGSMAEAEAQAYGGSIIDALFAQIADQLPTCDPAHVRAHAYGLLNDLAQEEQRRFYAETQGGGMVGRAKALAEQEFPRFVTLDEAAEACNVSPGVLKRMFQAQTGETFRQWDQGRRMSRAQELLLSEEMTIAQVAAEVGYLNASKFARAFRAYTGESPSDWRRSRL